MNLPNFDDIKSLSDKEISETIIKTETEICNLRIQSSTQQEQKPHELKMKKRILAQLKTLIGQLLFKKKAPKVDNPISD